MYDLIQILIVYKLLLCLYACVRVCVFDPYTRATFYTFGKEGGSLTILYFDNYGNLQNKD